MQKPVPCLLATAALVLGLVGCSDRSAENTGQATKSDPLAALQIKTARAESATDVPLGSVPGMVTLPPEARVAVSSPFQGAAIRVFVIEGQEVRRGQALALIRSADPVRFRADLSRTQSEVGLAEARAARLGQLAGEGIIAQARADEAVAALAQARASLAEQRRLVSLAGAGPDGTMTLRAPIAGRVSHVGVETGEPVDGLTAPFVVEASGRYQIELQLPERLAKAVQPGTPVEVSVASDTGSAPIAIGGQILTVAPSIDPATRSVMARASIGAEPGIVAGRNVSVTIKGAASQTGVSIPAAAVTRIGNADYVFVRRGKTYRPSKVVIVGQSGERAVVSEGLDVGDVVATSSVAELKAMAAK